MQTYWEHTERERAEMAAEQVESLLKLELMEAGVIAPTEPEYLPEDAPTLDATTKYGVKKGYSVCDLLFDSADDAAKAIELASGWKNNHYSLKVNTCDPESLEIQEVLIVSNDDLARHRSAMEKALANKNRNTKVREEFLKDCKAVEAVTENVWNDWHDQRATKRRLQEIADTFDEYAEIVGGDKATAREFLAKAYSEEEIAKAGEWLVVDALVTPESSEELATAD